LLLFSSLTPRPFSSRMTVMVNGATRVSLTTTMSQPSRRLRPLLLPRPSTLTDLLFPIPTLRPLPQPPHLLPPLLLLLMPRLVLPRLPLPVNSPPLPTRTRLLSRPPRLSTSPPSRLRRLLSMLPLRPVMIRMPRTLSPPELEEILLHPLSTRTELTPS